MSMYTQLASISAPDLLAGRRERLGSFSSASIRPPTETRISRRVFKLQMTAEKSLSKPVADANAEVGSTLDALFEVERAAGISSPAAGARGGTLPPPQRVAARRASGKGDGRDDSAMMKEHTRLFEGQTSASAAVLAATKKEEPKKEEKKEKKEVKKRSARDSSSVPPPDPTEKVGGFTRKSEAKLYVMNTFAELRSDDRKRAEFEARVAALMAEQMKGKGVKELIKANMRNVHMSSTQYLDLQSRKMAERAAAEKERCAKVLEARDLFMQARLNSIQQKIDEREAAHEARIAMAQNRERRQRAAAWFGLVMLASRSHNWGTRLAHNRTRRGELKVKVTASKALSIAWRMFIFRRRLKALWLIRTTVRPLIFWWRFNFRIRKKRRATATIMDYLVARKRLGEFNHFIKLYCHSVRKIQALWRQQWRVISAQTQICSVFWVHEDMKRGMSETGAKHAFQQDKELRKIIMRDDLRVRRRSLSNG